MVGLFMTLGKSMVNDGLSGSTVTSGIDWTTGVIPGNFWLPDLLLGNYIGAFGETCSVLLSAAGIYLMVRGIINYRVT